MAGRPCYLAVDLSSKQDISATVKLFPPVEHENRWVIMPRFFTPMDSLDKRSERDRAPYRLWCEQGWMEATPGNVIDHARIRETILDDARTYKIEALPYDPWNATQLAVELQGEGLPVVEFIQGLRSFTAPTKAFLDYLAERRFRHGGNPVLAWMAQNLFIQMDKNENMMPTKAKSTGRIDGIVATIMAMGVINVSAAPDIGRMLNQAILERNGFA